MKTASKNLNALAFSGAALALVLVFGGYAMAQTAAPAATSAPVASAAPTVPGQPTAAAPPVADASAPAGLSPLPAAGGNAMASRNKAMGALEDKVADSAKNVVKQLSTLDAVNLDDLNTARQTVAKLDVVIEIEKRLAELDKIHSDRNGEKNLASAIPASALSLPNTAPLLPPMTAPMDPMGGMMPAFAPPKPKLEVIRIAGADGHFTAMIQDKMVHVGDTLSDGSTVVSITNRQVTTKAKNGGLHTMSVKGVDEIYGHSL